MTVKDSQTMRTSRVPVSLLPWLSAVTGGPFLECPHIAVRVTEIRVKDPAHVVNIAQFDSTLG